jgi:cytochrome c556
MMRGLFLAACGVMAFGMAGGALAQGDVIAERRAGLRAAGATLEAVQQAVQARGDTRALVGRIDQTIAFYQSFPARFPTASLTPPVAQGTQDGQTRALAVIETNRAGFQTANANTITALTALRAAAESGSIPTDALRATGASCGACHQQFRAR